ncbi:FAD/NAD(P)-binding domain-containing protein [Massarina eburnea CBS 473.64]|uniref:FAD/NAD(P)-binding domain-containing protein n=1 Tax=Massarina eburnea CBS 473.64 TaxID=1395130 RepID=A0A6A6RIB9_9PLEO|nr:FAD/NAD(P)-binding domain-containing protein [Massarina eburnea CBS 473.64]
MSMQKPHSILISGAGVAGTTLALALARHPTMNPKPIITLIERSPVPRTTGQAIDIRGPGVKVIRKLGIEEKIRAKHTTETGITFLGRGGQQIARFDTTGDADNQSFSTSEFEVLRGELVQLLMEETEEARKKSGTEVKTVYGELIESLNDEKDGVTVNFANGKLESQKFDAVIATDGTGSRTRSMIFPEHKSLDCVKPLGFYIAYFTVPRLEHDTDLWQWYHAAGGLAIHMRPHRNKKTMGVYLSIVLPSKVQSPEIEAVIAKGVDAQKEMLRDRFKNAGWQIDRVLKEMDTTEDFYFQQSALVVTPKWASGRCAILGDAAFAAMGVGTSNAMIGAYMISGELANVKSNDAGEIAAALARYESGLRPLAGKNQMPPPGFPQLANPQTEWGIGVFHAVAKTVALTRLDKLLMKFGEPSEDAWKLPEYGF